MATDKIKEFRDFPSVEELLQHKNIQKSIESLPRPIVSEIVKNVIAQGKKDFKKGVPVSVTSLIEYVNREANKYKRDEISKVINATGVIIHTNLGRAPLSDELFDAVKQTTVGYGNIEFDIESGKRGNRGIACEKYLTMLSGAEASTVVNNCAAAIFLILNTFAGRKNVVISRSELVQIGGGFRIPDILKKSGAKLSEVGSTNITTIKDYEKAIDDKTALILKVHQSNFVQKGFVEQVSLKELVALGNKHSIPVVNDLGSGVFVPTKKILGYVEPTVQMSVRDGADLTCFSGDKMLGGGQAGLIVGKTEYIEKIKKNPIFRAMRVDKIVFAMLEKLLTFYLNNSWQENIKLWSLLSVSESELYKRGKNIQKNIGTPSGISVEATKSYIGGGALPESDIPSVGIIFSETYNPNDLMRLFRGLEYPIIGRIEADRFVLDLKSVDQEDLPYLEISIKKILSQLSC